jgi:hypothetical protein
MTAPDRMPEARSGFAGGSMCGCPASCKLFSNGFTLPAPFLSPDLKRPLSA